MAKKMWSGRLDELIIELVKRKAMDLERSEAYIIQIALREMFKNELPPDWKPTRNDNDE